MTLRARAFPLEVREISASGEFTGHASVYDVINFYNERVRRGAFAKTISAWKQRGKMPPILYQHRPGEPIGPILDMDEGERGLRMRGKLLVEDLERAREARALIKSGTISGLSIGFDVPEGGEEYDKDGVRILTEVDLWEVSIVTFPANREAGVESIHSIFKDHMPTIREFELFLRDAGFSRTQAAHIATRGLKALTRDAPSDEATADGLDARSIVDAVIKGLKHPTTA